MTQIGHFLCLLLGCLIGHLIVYVARGIWNFLAEKRIEIPEIKYDVADNPILSLKNRLGQAYVASHDQTVKKLSHRLLEYVELIDNWHKEQVLIMESERNGYERMCKQVQAELERERSKNAELEKQLKEEREKNKIPLFTTSESQPDYLIAENWFHGQVNPFAKIILNTKPGEPLTATKAEEEALKRSIRMDTGAIIHIDSEDLNRYSVGRGPDGNLLKDEPPIYNEEFIKKLREIWFGLDNDTECHQYSVTVRKYGDCNEKKMVVLARSPMEAAKLVPSGYTVENISRLFE